MAELTNEQAARMIEATIWGAIQESLFHAQLNVLQLSMTMIEDRIRSIEQRKIMDEQQREFERLKKECGMVD